MLNKRALARAGVADKSDELPVRYFDIDIVYRYFFKGRVRAVNMAQAAYFYL